MKDYITYRSNRSTNCNKNCKLGQLKIVLFALLLSLGIDPVAVKASGDRQKNSYPSRSKSHQFKVAKKDSAVTSRGKLPIADGIYLYGQSPQRDRLGQEYTIFEMRRSKVIGAFYLPQSEFSCFQGTLASGKLSVTVAADANSEADSAQVAAAGTQPEAYKEIPSSYTIGLQNYYQLTHISDGDRRILSACQQNYQH